MTFLQLRGKLYDFAYKHIDSGDEDEETYGRDLEYRLSLVEDKETLEKHVHVREILAVVITKED